MRSIWAFLALSLPLHFGQGLAARVLHRRANVCSELSQSYPNSTIHPGSSVFAEIVIEPWSQTCQTTPLCIFAPASTEEVAGGLAILRKANETFAVRTQGYMPVPGAADISNNVLMVTTSLNSVQYADDSKSVVQIGAGNSWLDVYQVLAKDNLAVAGGRFGPVGVSGVLLGGGISYFNSGLCDGKSLVSTTASLASLYTAIVMWNLVMGIGPHGSRIHQITSDTLPLPSTFSTTRESSIEVFIIVTHVHALAMMTLHRSRKQDRYQNAMAGFCILGVVCGCLYGFPGRTWQGTLILMMASLPAVMALGFSLSAMVHACLGFWESRQAIRLQAGRRDEKHEERWQVDDLEPGTKR